MQRRRQRKEARFLEELQEGLGSGLFSQHEKLLQNEWYFLYNLRKSMPRGERGNFPQVVEAMLEDGVLTLQNSAGFRPFAEGVLQPIARRPRRRDMGLVPATAVERLVEASHMSGEIAKRLDRFDEFEKEGVAPSFLQSLALRYENDSDSSREHPYLILKDVCRGLEGRPD